MTRDYYAEMYVAGLLADAGWNIYFPHRDKGFDFIITKDTSTGIVVRPVQVKGLYPTVSKTPKRTYGYNGSLSLVHHEMALIIPYFSASTPGSIPTHIAYMPRAKISTQKGRGFKCHPWKYTVSGAVQRKEFVKYFDLPGMRAMETTAWK